VSNSKWVIRRRYICCIMLVLALLALVACQKEAAESTPDTAVVEETIAEGGNLVGSWQMKFGGTDLLSKSGLVLAADGTFTYLGQRGETLDSGKYTIDGDQLSLDGTPCTSSGGVKVSPCVGVYTISVTQSDTTTIMTLQLVEDPSLNRSLAFGGQDFVLVQ